MSANTRRWRLCDLPLGVRLGLVGLVLTLAGGLLASWYYLFLHYSPRDGNKNDLTYVDVASAYHKMQIPAPLKVVIERGHPRELTGESLPEAERKSLLDWLASPPESIMRAYEDETLEELMPAEIVFNRCVSCHDAQPTDTAHPYPQLPLYTPAEVQAVAISRDIEPTPERILAASTHAHALTLAVQSMIVIGLLLGTRVPRALVSIAAVLLGFSLLADIGSWWLARQNAAFVYVIFGAGGVFNATSALCVLAVLLDLVVPWTEARESA